MDLKYLSNGQAVDLKHTLPDGTFLVEVLYQSDYEGHDEYFPTEEIRVVTAIYDEAPTALFDERIEKLNGEIEALEARRREVQTLVADEEKKAKDRIAFLTKNEKLRLLEDFIAGRITHFVDLGNFTIKTLTEALEYNDSDYGYRRDVRLRLLSLYGDSKGDVAWNIGAYRDGSGHAANVIPCLSYEHAREVLQELLNQADGSKDYTRSKAIQAAKKHSLVVPQAWIDAQDAAVRAGREKNLKNAEEALAKAQAELAALDNGGA